MMLVLTRKLGETIRIGDAIEITVVSAGTSRLKLGIKAPGGARILRSELDPGRSSEDSEHRPRGKDVFPVRSKRRRPSRRHGEPAPVETVGA